MSSHSSGLPKKSTSLFYLLFIAILTALAAGVAEINNISLLLIGGFVFSSMISMFLIRRREQFWRYLK